MSVQTGSELGLLENIALHYRDEGKLAQALPVYVQAASLAEADDTEHAAKLWNNAGICALKVYDPDRAAECFRNALEATMEGPLDHEGRLSRLYANLTAAYYEGSRIREAWDAARQALMMAEEIGDPKAVGHALYNLGLAERYLGEFDEAIKLFAEARRRYLEAGEASRAADAMHNIGWVRLDRVEPEVAEPALWLARDEKRALGESTARIELELARLSLARENWIAALSTALAIAESAEAWTDPVTRIQALTLAAEAAGHGDLPAALHYAAAALNLALSMGRPPILLDLLPLLIRLRADAGQALSHEEHALAREMFERRHGVQGQLCKAEVSLN